MNGITKDGEGADLRILKWFEMVTFQGQIFKKDATKIFVSSKFRETRKVHAKAARDINALKILKIFKYGFKTFSRE